MEFDELQEFQKDVKKLKKKFRSLDDDISTLKKVIATDPNQRPPFSYEINGLGIEKCVIKVKKIACRSLKGKGVNTGLRLVYAYFEEQKRILLIELYFKANQENENRERIIKYLKD